MQTILNGGIINIDNYERIKEITKMINAEKKIPLT